MRKQWSALIPQSAFNTALLLNIFFHRNIRHAFVTIVKEEGGLFSGCLFRGLGPSLIVSNGSTFCRLQQQTTDDSVQKTNTYQQTTQPIILQPI